MATFRKPRRITGRVRPDPNDGAAQAKAEHAQTIVESIWVDTDGQRAILNNVRSYMRVCKARPRRGMPINGRRLSQFSQAGKSAIAERLIVEVEEQALAAGEPANPYRVIHITIDPGMTLKMLLQEILNRLADDFVDEPDNKGLRVTREQAEKIRGKSGDNIKILEQRVEEWVRKLGVELIVVDEVQRLVTKADRTGVEDPTPQGTLTADAEQVSKKLQGFLDRGVVPLFFIGDETSPRFFKLNPHFAARLLKPLELRPLQIAKTPERKQFHDFCVKYDRQLVKLNVVAVQTCLTRPEVLAALITASGGHIGRAARIIQVAVPAAVGRGAVTLEPYDLSNAVRDFAMGVGWVDHDPFSIVPDPVLAQSVQPAEMADAD